jgi:hypothetical protein
MKLLAEFLEREAGHVLIGLLLILCGAILVLIHIPKSEDLIPFALGVIARSMVGGEEPKRP